MTKTIDTLVQDIQQLLGKGVKLDEAALAKFGAASAMHVVKSLEERSHGKRKPKTLYVSEVGQPCHRRLWYGVNTPELAEKLPPSAQIKFLYGDLIEEMLLLLAEAAGHEVTNRQELTDIPIPAGSDGFWNVRGRKDAVIDGVLVDVKSCSSFAYKKFQEGLNDDNDSFGYRAQLNTYNGGKYERQGFLAIDKQNGHFEFFEIPHESTVDQMFESVRSARSVSAPERAFELQPEGMSGNMKLGIECSYCPYKAHCWRDANGGAGLYVAAYERGPVFLGTMVRTPRVPVVNLAPPTITIKETTDATEEADSPA